MFGYNPNNQNQNQINPQQGKNINSKNAQNNNMPLDSFNEKITNQKNNNNVGQNNNNQNNINNSSNITFGEGGVDETFVPLSQSNKSKNKKYNQVIEHNLIEQNNEKKAQDIKQIKESFKMNNEESKKQSNRNNLSSSINNNNHGKRNIIDNSKRAQDKNPFYRSQSGNIPNSSVHNNINDNFPNNNFINFRNIMNPLNQINNNNPMNNNQINQINQNEQNNNIINININQNRIQPGVIPNPNPIQNPIIINQNQNNNQNRIQPGVNPNPNPIQNPISINQNQNNQPYSFDRYKKAALTGLKNLGRTSYLNSVLQLICSFRHFASYFSNPSKGEFFKNNVEQYSLSYVIHRVCHHLYPYPEKNKREIYTPENVMQILGKYNIKYKDFGEKNQNEFIISLLGKLHDELNKKKNFKNDDFKTEIIKKDKDMTINASLKHFVNNNDSIISNYFIWFKIKQTKCIKCSNEFYTFQYFPSFDLNILDCAKFYKNKIQEIKIENCLEFYSMYKYNTKTFCSFCKAYGECASETLIYSSPIVFIFLLDFKGNQNINFVIEQRINIDKFVENKNAPSSYDLNGIVYYDLNKKKYNAFCVSPVDKRWYLYDDENVNLIEFEIFINMYKTSKIFIPFILLYNSEANNRNKIK